MLRPLSLGLGLCALLPVAVARAENMVLTPQNMLRLAIVFLDQGRPVEAMGVAQALLARDPRDTGALLIKSRAQRDLADYRAATATGRQAWQQADTARERFGAAMAVAQGLGSSGQKFRAQFWLRRAIEEAPDDGARAMAVRDFRYVRNRSRLAFRLDASARPSSNVNGGTSEEIIDFYGIPLTISPDSRALSGGRAQLAATARYRIAETAQSKADLRLAMVERRVWLSAQSKRDAPAARAGDYSYSGVEAGVDGAWKLPMPGGEVTASASLGHNRYGGRDMSDYGRLDLGLGRAFAGGYTGRLAFSLERQKRLDDPARSATIYDLSAMGARRLGNGDRLSLGLGLRETASPSAQIDHRAVTADLGWEKAAPVLGAALSLGFGVEARDYAVSALSATGRQDLAVRGNLSLSFDKIDYMGFVPVMTIEAEHTKSNIALNRSRSLGVGLSVQSKF